MRRRQLLKCGLFGASSLTLPGLLQMRSEAAISSHGRSSVILLYCHGGISHIDTWDPKPDAPIEIRGPFQPIETRVPGMVISELLPRQAAISDKFTLLRSLSHEASCHANGPKRLFSGHFTLNQEFKPEHPDFLAITNYLRWRRGRSLPNYVGMTTYGLEPGPVSAIGPAYLGNKYAPLPITGDPNTQNTLAGLQVDQNGTLVRRDQLRKELDRSRLNDAEPELVNEFHQQAVDILTRPDAQRAFNLELEPPEVRDRYGRTAWGQHCLMARRLVESGVDLVTVTLCGREAGGAGNNWDDHAVNCDIFAALKNRADNFDRCISTLIEDLFERGLDKRVLLIVTSEFGRTPRINRQIGNVTKVEQPGRDHWPQAMSILFAGGGIPGGQVIGETNNFGEHPIERKYEPWDMIATVYRHLGIDAQNVTVPDLLGRPVPILPQGHPIPELTRRA